MDLGCRALNESIRIINVLQKVLRSGTFIADLQNRTVYLSVVNNPISEGVY